MESPTSLKKKKISECIILEEEVVKGLWNSYTETPTPAPAQNAQPRIVEHSPKDGIFFLSLPNDGI